MSRLTHKFTKIIAFVTLLALPGCNTPNPVYDCILGIMAPGISELCRTHGGGGSPSRGQCEAMREEMRGMLQNACGQCVSNRLMAPEKSGGFEDPQVLAILNAEVPAEIEPVTSLTAMSVSSVGSSKGAAPGTGSKAGGKIEGKACDSSTIKHIFYNCRDQGITIPTDCP